jgi:outer membrane protein assembly factor BamB
VSWEVDRGENVVWGIDLPGQGHSSPILRGDRIFLTTSDPERETQSVLCLDRETGRVRWETELFRGRLPKEIHRKNTHASPSPACDGERVYAVFHVGDEIQLAALDLEGRVSWKIRAGGFVPQYRFGYAPSPWLHGEFVIVAAESKPDGFVAAFRTRDGSRAWTAPRGEGTSYSSPVVARLGGSDQLLLSGHGKITSYDPLTGALRWQGSGCTAATCGTVVWDGPRNLVFASGGFPDKETVAMRADGSGTVAWRNKVQAYEQSLLARDGFVYGLDDNGIARCWNAGDGTERWAERLGGPVSSSPVSVGEWIYAGNERGEVFVFAADPTAFRLVAKNRVGDDLFASPAVADGRIYYRVGIHRGDRRTERLLCVGEGPNP